MVNEYTLTKDWFTDWAPEVWKQLIPLMPERKNFLEIGSFEGRSTLWTIENMMEDGSTINCIDTWQGGEEHGAEDMAIVEARFDANRITVMGKHPHRWVEKYKGTSMQHIAVWLARTPGDRPAFDFIYIDGSHVARDVLMDACMAWPLLKPKGIMVFDDYLWGHSRDILHRPKIAIDAFCNIFAEEVDIIHSAYQMALRKKEKEQ